MKVCVHFEYQYKALLSASNVYLLEHSSSYILNSDFPYECQPRKNDSTLDELHTYAKFKFNF